MGDDGGEPLLARLIRCSCTFWMISTLSIGVVSGVGEIESSLGDDCSSCELGLDDAALTCNTEEQKSEQQQQ